MERIFIVDYRRNNSKDNTVNDEIVLCKVVVNEKGIFEDVKFSRIYGGGVVRYVHTLSSSAQTCNFKLGKNNNIVAKGYNFDCFSNKVKPSVIVNNIKTKAGKLIGYTIIRFDGKCMRIKLADAIRLAQEAKQRGCVAFQNCIYVEQSAEKRAHLRAANEVVIPDFIIQDSVKKVDPSKLQKATPAKEPEKPESVFTPEQLKQLRLGKDNGINYKIYMNPKLSAEQMEQIRLITEAGFNGAYVAFPEYTVGALKFYLTDYKNGAEIRYYLNPKYSTAQLFQLSLGAADGIDIKQYKDPKINSLEMEEIRNRLTSKLWTEVRYEITEESIKS